MTRAFYRPYPGRGTVLHVMREDGPFPGKQGECGAPGWSGRTTPVILDPIPGKPPEGVTWCATCVGRLARRLGILAPVARDVASYANR